MLLTCGNIHRYHKRMDHQPPVIGEFACIAIAGVDARRFAQTQFSGDVDVLVPGRWQWNAWLNAQGRVQALMHLADRGDGTLLAVLRGGDAEAIRAGLARYLLRMPATLSLRRFTGMAGAPLPVGALAVEPDGAIVLGFGGRSLRLTSGIAEANPAASAAWRLNDIRQGLPTLPASGETEFLPPALGLEHLGAVAFRKGCYPGQEIAARLHFRGGHKQRLAHLRGGHPLPMGPTRDAQDKAVWILDTVTAGGGTDALAVVPIDTSFTINILEYTHVVISIFDA